MSTKIRRYTGKLYYNEFEHIDISAFIMRGTEIGFSLASVTKDHGRWEAESGKPAVLQRDGSYLVKGVLATKGNTKSSPWDIVFRIENEENPEESIEVYGELIEDGKSYPFRGELDVSPPV